MERVKGTKGLASFECIYPLKNKWVTRFDVQPTINENGLNEVNYLEQVFDYKPSIEDIKATVAVGIDLYDSSEAINSFSINGIKLWLDKQTRTSLSYTLSLESEGVMSLWSPGLPPVRFDIEVPLLKQMLNRLEMYAKETYDVTQNHKATVYGLSTADEVLNYDFRAGYPETITF